MDRYYVSGCGPFDVSGACFKLPIEYIDHVQVSDVILQDLEMRQSKNIYANLFPGTSLLLNRWSTSYTTNKAFLVDFQNLLSVQTDSSDVTKTHAFLKEYLTFKGVQGFFDKYQYLGLKFFQPLNRSSIFLHALGFYNLSAPLFALCAPLFAFIVPFVLLKLKGMPLTISDYIVFLRTTFMRTQIYNLFSGFTQANVQQKVSTIFSIFFYMLQFYNNVMSCFSFYKNMTVITGFLNSCKEHLEGSLRTMTTVIESVRTLSTFELFRADVEANSQIVRTILSRLQQVIFPSTTIEKLTQLGVIMSIYFDLYMDPEYHSAMLYSVYLNQYVNDVASLAGWVQQGRLNPCTYGDKCTKMVGAFYLPLLADEAVVKNDVDLEKNLLITGPNAAGKTTMLKTVLINLLLGQQFGVGCYTTATVKPYDLFHSYLNIPDTSGRDSLFQAEARRCKEILEAIDTHHNKQHFCIFDEIFSGTNPNDAVMCATVYLKYLNAKCKPVFDYIVTTHYIELCENFEETTEATNMKMDVNADKEDQLVYLYRLVPGISYIHGGKHVLKDLGYPDHLFTMEVTPKDVTKVGEPKNAKKRKGRKTITFEKDGKSSPDNT
jgi:hypothetical protein